jgi:hypothetical protein
MYASGFPLYVCLKSELGDVEIFVWDFAPPTTQMGHYNMIVKPMT